MRKTSDLETKDGSVIMDDSVRSSETRVRSDSRPIDGKTQVERKSWPETTTKMTTTTPTKTATTKTTNAQRGFQSSPKEELDVEEEEILHSLRQTRFYGNVLFLFPLIGLTNERSYGMRMDGQTETMGRRDRKSSSSRKEPDFQSLWGF